MAMSTTVSIIYPALPPREFSRNSREHWSALHRAQNQVTDDMLALLLESGWRHQEPPDRSEVGIEMVLPDKRRRDADNLITCCKPLLDALVKLHVIKDDCIGVIGFPRYSWRYEKGISATEITVREVDTDDPM